MITHDKHLKREQSLDEGITSVVKSFISVLKILDKIAKLKYEDLSPDQMQDKIDSLIKEVDKILRKYDTKPVYRDMIRCGVDSALRNLNTTNRLKLQY